MRCLNCSYDGISKLVEICPACHVYLPILLKETLAPGTELCHGSYHLDYALAKGGFGIIYQGFHKRLDRQVAIKEFFPDKLGLQREEFGTGVKVSYASRQEFEKERDQFLYEARLLASLKHPGVVAVYDFFEEKNTVYLVMEMVQGQSLRQEINKAKEGLPGQRVEFLLEALVPILSYLHKRGIYHLDIKPDNIMIGGDGRPILIDFGAASDLEKQRSIPQYDERYCAPEVPTGTGIGPQSDLYELGMTVYELLTGSLQPSMFERKLGREWSVEGLDAFWTQLLEPLLRVHKEHRPTDIEVWWDRRPLLGRRGVGKEYVAPRRKALPSRRVVLQGAGKFTLAIVFATVGTQAYTTLFASAAPGMNLEIYRGHAQPVHVVAWSPDNSLIASAGEAGTVLIWQSSSASEMMAYMGHSKAVNALAWSPDGQEIASGGQDGTVQVWKTGKGEKVWSYKGQNGPVQCVVWSPDGKHIASAGENAVMRIWSPTTGQMQMTLRGGANSIYSLAWSPDSRSLASVGDDRVVTTWNVLTGKARLMLSVQKGIVNTLAWSPDGQQLVSGDNEKMLAIWDARSGKRQRTWIAHDDSVTMVAWSPDGQALASGSKDKTVKIWRASDGNLLLTYRQHSAQVDCLDWSHDSRYIVSASEDRTVQVWEAMP